MASASNGVEERLSREIHVLTEISKTLTLPLELPELLAQVMQRLIDVVDQADAGIAMLWDQSAGLFRPAASFGFDVEALKQLGLRAGESVTGKVYDEGKACLLLGNEQVSGMMADMRPANRLVYARALGSDSLPLCILAVPVSAGEQRYGVLVLETLRQHATFDARDLPFVQSLADLIALAIDRARLEIKADAVRAAQEAERLRSEMMATLSHELRMPLTAIKGYATALLLDDVSFDAEKQRQFLRMISDESDAMHRMIKDILDSSIIDVNQLNLECEPVRLQRLARDVANEVQRRTEIHHLVVDIPADFPLANVDFRWIKQVFRNIIDNAIKYSPDGGLIVIRGEVRTNDVLLSIADQGIGISPEDLIPLFEKFFRVRSAANFHVSGTGLGLPIARAIIEAHGGRIWVESGVGHGTTVYFTLPIAQPIPDEG